MKNSFLILSCSALMSLNACSSEVSDSPGSEQGKPDYFVVDENLTRIRSDFNAMADKIRLVFIIGPSCGICLRGMDDLNTSIVKHIQNDPRIHTFAIHVPTLGAEEKHVAASIPLLKGPRVTHYWDPAGQTGLLFRKTLGMDVYAWDIWMVYQPGAKWEEGLPPPPPAYMEHQLPVLPKDLKLDAERFAAEVRQRLASIPVDSVASSAEPGPQIDAGIIAVAQPRGVMIQQNHESRGGYQNIKKIVSLRLFGKTHIDDREYDLSAEMRRPGTYQRVIGEGSNQSAIIWNGVAVTRKGTPPGLPDAIQDQILASFEFDGWMTNWKSKGHQLTRLGMTKYGDRLPWLLRANLNNGTTWNIYVDSHSGDAFRTALIDSSGQESMAIEYSDYRDVEGYRLPHQADYFAGHRLLMSDRFSRIVVETNAKGKEPEFDDG